jgi:hypothetical protein
MKTNELNSLGIFELNDNELNDVGAGFGLALALAIVGAAIYLYNNSGDFVKGFKEGMK